MRAGMQRPARLSVEAIGKLEAVISGLLVTGSVCDTPASHCSWWGGGTLKYPGAAAKDKVKLGAGWSKRECQ